MGYGDVQNFNAIPMVYSHLLRAQKISRYDRKCTCVIWRAARCGMWTLGSDTQMRLKTAVFNILRRNSCPRNHENEHYLRHHEILEFDEN